MASLVLDEKHSQENQIQIARVRKLGENLDLGAKRWDEIIGQLHSTCAGLTSETDATRIETLIATAHLASDHLKKSNDELLSFLHILEGTDSILRANLDKLRADLDKMHELKIRRAELDLETAIREVKRNEKGADRTP